LDALLGIAKGEEVLLFLWGRRRRLEKIREPATPQERDTLPWEVYIRREGASGDCI